MDETSAFTGMAIRSSSREPSINVEHCDTAGSVNCRNLVPPIEHELHTATVGRGS